MRSQIFSSALLSVCMLFMTNVSKADVFCATRSNFDKVYSARGHSRIEAKTNVQQVCGSDVNGMFCENEVQCETSSRYHTFYCATKSNFDKVYSGRGYSELEAKTVAQQNCGNDVNGMFCENSVECEQE